MTKLKTIGKIQHVPLKGKLQPETADMSWVNCAQERKREKEGTLQA